MWRSFKHLDGFTLFCMSSHLGLHQWTLTFLTFSVVLFLKSFTIRKMGFAFQTFNLENERKPLCLDFVAFSETEVFKIIATQWRQKKRHSQCSKNCSIGLNCFISAWMIFAKIDRWHDFWDGYFRLLTVKTFSGPELTKFQLCQQKKETN